MLGVVSSKYFDLDLEQDILGHYSSSNFFGLHKAACGSLAIATSYSSVKF